MVQSTICGTTAVINIWSSLEVRSFRLQAKPVASASPQSLTLRLTQGSQVPTVVYSVLEYIG